MGNPFDKFDDVQSDPQSTSDANPFDQFDSTPKNRTLKQVAGDAGIALLKGAISLPQAFVGLADIATGGRAGKGLESIGYRPEDAKKSLDELYSDPQKTANSNLQKAEGFGETIATIAANPSTIPITALESLPSMLGGAGVARGAIRALPKMAPVIAGAIGEGAVGAGSSAAQSRSESKDGLLSTRQTAAAIGSGVGTGLLGFAGGKLAQKLGIADVDTILASGKGQVVAKGFARQVIGAGISEGVFEEMPQSAQEQMWANYAAKKPIMDGVGKSMAIGLSTGAAMGMAGGVGNVAMPKGAETQGAINNQSSPQATESQQDIVQPVPMQSEELFGSINQDQQSTAPFTPPTQSVSRAVPPSAPDESMQFADLDGDAAPDGLGSTIPAGVPAGVPTPAMAPAEPANDIVHKAYGDSPVLVDLIRTEGGGLGLGGTSEALMRMAPKIAAAKELIANKRAREAEAAIAEQLATMPVQENAPVDPPADISPLQQDIAKIKAMKEAKAAEFPQKQTDEIVSPATSDSAPDTAPVIRSYPQKQAVALAARMTRQGLPSETYPHHSGDGTFAIRAAEKLPVETKEQPADAKELNDLVQSESADLSGRRAKLAEYVARKKAEQKPMAAPALDDIRPPKERIHDVAKALTNSYRILGDKTVPVESLVGGVGNEVGDQKRVRSLADKLKGPDAYIERLIVDDSGNVIEGQHRLDALKLLGVKNVPVVVIQDFERNFPTAKVSAAIAAAQKLHSDHINQLASNLAEIYADEKGNIAEIVKYEVPRGFEKAWAAGLDVLSSPKAESATPEKSLAVATNAAPTDLVKVRSVVGESVYVRQAHIDSDRAQLPMFNKDGTRKQGKATTIHRDNLDPTGEKQQALNKESSPGVISRVGKNGDMAFATETSAKLAAIKHGVKATHDVVPASTVSPGSKGFVLAPKAGIPETAQHIENGKAEAKKAEESKASAKKTPNAKPENKPAEMPAEASNTEDSGAELTRNRRNRLTRGLKWDDIADKNAALRVKEVVKSKVYLKPGYQAMIDGGVPPIAAHLVKQVYDSIAITPSTGRNAATDSDLQLYINAINRVMSAAEAWAADKQAVGKWAAKYAKAAGSAMDQSAAFSYLADNQSLLESVYPGGWKDYRAELTILGGNKLLGALQPSYDEARRATKDIEKGWPEKREAWQQQGYKVQKTEDVASVRSTNVDGKFYIRIANSFAESFPDQATADSALAAYKPFLLIKKNGRVASQHDSEAQAIEAARESTKRDPKDETIKEEGHSVESSERIGPARRLEGENISSDKLKETFGLKAVNFGTWMKGNSPALMAERQLHLNHAYDSFLDLAGILNVPPKAMSLNGMLGLAIGAQGNGGTAAAHFVAGVNEINLTRTAGAGALAHELAHGIDHYFARLAGIEREKTPFLTAHATGKRLEQYVDNGRAKLRETTFAPELRPEILDQFKAIVKTMTNRLETQAEADARAKARAETLNKNVQGWLKSLRHDFSSASNPDIANMGYVKAGALATFDKLAARVMALDLGDGKIAIGQKTDVSPVVAEMHDVFKKAFARTLDIGSLFSLQANIDAMKYQQESIAGNKAHEPQIVTTNYKSESTKADKGKPKPYWGTELEMFARAFDAFVVDTLAAKSAKNTYLAGIEAVAPQGEERKAINQAFQSLINEIKTKETDNGVVMFSRNDHARDRENIDTAIRRIGKFVDEAEAGRLKDSDTQILGSTPTVLQALGFDPLQLQIDGATVKEIINGKHGQTMSADLLRQLPEGIYNPLAVFDSKDAQSGEGGKLLVTELHDRLGNPVIAIVHLGKKSNRMVVNDIASAYGLDNYRTRKKVSPSKLEYIRDEKALASSTTPDRLFWAGVVQKARELGVKVLSESDIVNLYGMKFSRTQSPENRIAASDLSAVVGTARKTFPIVPIIVAEHESQLPDALQKEIAEADAQGEVAGAFHEGSIYLVRDNLRGIAHAEDTILHEVEHAGLRKLFGADLDPVMLDIWKSNLGVQIAASKIKNQYGYSQVRSIEEAMAEMGPKVTKLKGWFALVAWVRAKLRKMGLVKEWTDQDVEALVLRAIGSVKRGGKTNLYSGSALSRGENGGKITGMADKDTVAGTQAPTSAGDGETGIAKLPPHVLAAQQILSEIETDPLADYGLRIIPGEFDGKIAVGDVLPNSRVWEDGNETLDELKGTSTSEIRRADIDSIVQSIKDLGAHGKNGKNGFYFGDRVVLVKGDPVGFGEDAGERIIANAEVVGIWKKPNKGLSEILPNKKSSPAGSGDSDTGARFSRIIGDSNRQYTPSQQAMHKNTGREIDPPTILEKLKKAAGKNWTQGIFDQFEPIKNISRHAYVLTRLSRGASGAIEAFLMNGKLRLRDGIYDADTSGGVLKEVFYPIGKETTDFLYWIAGNRAERLASEGKERLFSTADIAAAKSLADGKTDFDYVLPNGKVTRDRPTIYNDSLRKFNEFNKNVMDMAEQSGLIDGLSRHMWEHEFYVPFYRVIDDDDSGVRGMNIKQGVVRQTAFKKLKGGKEGLNDLLANTLMNWAHLIDASAKNRAARETLKASVAMKIAHPAKAGEKNTVWYMDGGKKMEFGVDDPELLTALNGLDFAGIKGPMMDVLSKPKEWLTIGVTASPFFKIKNLIRDSVQSVAVSGLSYNAAGNLVNGYKLTKHDRQEYVSALAGGALIRFGTMLEGNEASRTRQLIKKGSTDAHILDNESKVRQFYDKRLEPWVAAYNELGNRGEEINRMALYDQLIKQGMSHAEASFQARDLMDFSAKGSFTTIRLLTQLVPFMNARLQGMYKLGRAYKEDRAKFAVVTGAVAAVSVLLAIVNSGDPEWEKREDFDKDNYWWMKFGDTVIKIPKPFEIGAVGTLAERSYELLASKLMENDKMTGERFAKATFDAIMNQLSMNPIPQVFKPILDIYSNKDSFTGRPIESMSMDRVDPEYRFTANTSMPARGVSKVIGGALSPVQIDHLVRGYLAWLGATAVGTADLIVRYATDEKDRPRQDYWKLATGGIVSDKDSAGSRYVSQMYEQAKELESAYATFSQLRKEGKIDEANEYRSNNIEKLKKYGTVEAAKKAVSNLGKQIRSIERGDLAADVKRYKINQLRKQQNDYAKRLYPDG